MLRVALTGGIGSGKSYCLRRFAMLGVPTVDADALARDAVGTGTAVLRAIEAHFGSHVMAADGSLDRPALARIVFSDPKARAALESLIHPEVYRRIQDWFANLPARTSVAIADIPLVYETGQAHQFDRIVVAACTRDEQIRRVVERDHLSHEEAAARLSAQWPIEEKAARAWRVIWTDRGFTATDGQVDQVYRELSTVNG